MTLFFLLLITIFSNTNTVDLSIKSINCNQHIDETSNLVYPWFTKSFLDVLSKWDIKDWKIFEWGSGYSTLWLANKCKKIVSIESDERWGVGVQKYLSNLNLKNVNLKVRTHNTKFNLNNAESGSAYVNSIHEDDEIYDCIIVDGEARNDCVKEILTHIKPNGIVIFDNANHTAIEIDSWDSYKFLQHFAYEHHSYGLPNAKINDPSYYCWHDYTWRTDYWKIKKDHDPKNKLLIEYFLELGKAKLPFIIDPNFIFNKTTRVTLLMVAAHNNLIKLTEILLKIGANKDLKDINGSTALSYAINQNNSEIIKMLQN